jgi:hypothetical protein
MERSSKLQLHADIFTRLRLSAQHLELQFWYLSIHLMRESKSVRMLIQTIALLLNPALHKNVIKGIILLGLGIFSGFSIGVFSQLFIQ